MEAYQHWQSKWPPGDGRLEHYSCLLRDLETEIASKIGFNIEKGSTAEPLLPPRTSN
jgi:hypothetical protein